MPTDPVHANTCVCAPPPHLQVFNVTAPLMGIIFLGVKDSQLNWAAG